MELVSDFESLRYFASVRQDEFRALARSAGLALARIHRDLVLDWRNWVIWNDKPVDHGDAVFIHGDFNIFNVGYSRSSQSLVILDWSTAPLLGREGNFCSRHFDILWFASSLFRFPLQRLKVDRRLVEASAFDFLAAYGDATPDRFCVSDAAATAIMWRDLFLSASQPWLPRDGSILRRLINGYRGADGWRRWSRFVDSIAA
jgi:hypothetical protein